MLNDVDIPNTSHVNDVNKRVEKKKLDFDQIGLIMDILGRLQSGARSYPRMSKQQDALKLAALLEIMDIFGSEFADKDAAGNALCHFSEFDELRGME